VAVQMHQHAAVDARLWVCECGVDVCVRVRQGPYRCINMPLSMLDCGCVSVV
jgi:hypothetical protein